MKLDKLSIIFMVCLFVFAGFQTNAEDTENCTFKVVFNNTTDQKVNYLFYWFDHSFGHQGSANMAGGELDAHENRIVEYEYQCGIYYVKWYADDYNHVYAFSHHEIDGKLRILSP